MKSVNTVALLHYKNFIVQQPDRTSCTIILKQDLFDRKMADGEECSGNLFGNVIIYANPFSSAK